MSEYEKKRIARKKENAAMLAALGLAVPASKSDQDDEEQQAEEEAEEQQQQKKGGEAEAEIQDDPDMLADFDDAELFGTAEGRDASHVIASSLGAFCLSQARASLSAKPRARPACVDSLFLNVCVRMFVYLCVFFVFIVCCFWSSTTTTAPQVAIWRTCRQPFLRKSCNGHSGTRASVAGRSGLFDGVSAVNLRWSVRNDACQPGTTTTTTAAAAATATCN